MKGKRFDENRIRELVRLGSDFKPVPAKAEARVLAVIREKTAARPRFSLLGVFRYSPALAVAAALIVALPLVAVLAGTLFFPAAERFPLVAVSDKGGVVAGREAPLRFGDTFAENDVVRTGAGEQVALERKGLIALQLFSRSTLAITGFAETRRDLSLRLERGALYVDKPKREGDDARVAVAIDSYTFTLKGTRAYFSVSDGRIIRVICYDGLVEAAVRLKPEEVLFTVEAGEKVELRPDGAWNTVRTLNADEKTLDEDLRRGLPRLDFIKELVFSPSSPTVLPERETDTGETIPPYSVAAVGSIAGKKAPEEGVRFYGAAEAGGRVFLVNQESVFTLEENGVVPRPGLVSQAAFMTRPFAAGRCVAFAKPGAVVLVDPESLQSAAVVALPKDGSIDHNFLPSSSDGRLYLPVQNNGYYVMDPEARPPSLRLLVGEPFPLAPLAAGAGLCIGSYYNTYVSGVTAEGRTVFKAQFKGNSAVNLVAAERSIYLYAAEPAGPFIVRLDSTGRETGRWKLPAALKADFLVAGGRVVGIFGDGRLFTLNTAGGGIAVIDRLFKKELTSRQWRNAGLGRVRGLLYAPTDRGSLLVINPLRGLREEEIAVRPGEEFYTAPFAYQSALYAVADSGTVYRIVKNAR